MKKKSTISDSNIMYLNFLKLLKFLIQTQGYERVTSILYFKYN